jgi:hypothetical protein
MKEPGNESLEVLTAMPMKINVWCNITQLPLVLTDVLKDHSAFETSVSAYQ